MIAGTFSGLNVPQASDGRVYRVSSGALPPGLTLDATTGTLSGSPTGCGVTTFFVDLAINHAGSTYTSPAVLVVVSIIEGAIVLSYGPCCGAANVGDAVSLSPTSSYLPVPGGNHQMRRISFAHARAT